MNATGTQQDGGIALYTSKDLYSWQYESVVLPVFNCTDNNTYTSPLSQEEKGGRSEIMSTRGRGQEGVATYPAPSCANGNGLDLERPKVVQCGGPGSGGKFVMWVRRLRVLTIDERVLVLTAG